VIADLPVLGDRRRCAVPKRALVTRKRATARKKRERRMNTAEVRAYVFAREKGICRCCGYMAAESMHELRPRSLGGLVCKENSIAVCGDGTRGCHGKLQRHEIQVRLGSKRKGAEGFLAFRGLSLFPEVERGSEPGSGRVTAEWAK
jgi:hypothetical protein